MKVLLFVIASAWATLDTIYRCLDRVTRGHPPEWLTVSIEQFTGVYCAFAILPLVRYASDLHRWTTYLWAVPVFSVLHTSLNWATRAIAFPVAGLGGYDYGAMPMRYLMEFPSDVIGFTLACYIRRQYLAWERSREMEKELAAARMALLTKQLQPHFLFNALNTISALMYEDVPKADLVLHRLSAFLRSTIDLRDTATIPLSEELQLLENYLAVMRARMENRLEIRMECDEGAGQIPVPPLLLQPLVENAIEHGRSASDGRVRIELSVKLGSSHLEGSLRDHGPGWKDAPDGYGLEAVRQRLATIYGDAASLEAKNHPDGGAVVAWRLPLC